MEIRKSTSEDLNTIMNIYARARKFMAENGNYIQWGPTNWPPESLICDDITAGNSYVCVDNQNKIIGVFYYDYGRNIDQTYDVIENGKWLNDEPYGVVHRIASDGTAGVGTFCINWAFEQAGHLRMDTHDSNIPMNNLLKKLGFKYTGIIHVVEDEYPRNAYEKI